jgi:hypothetical protein
MQHWSVSALRPNIAFRRITADGLGVHFEADPIDATPLSVRASVVVWHLAAGTLAASSHERAATEPSASNGEGRSIGGNTGTLSRGFLATIRIGPYVWASFFEPFLSSAAEGQLLAPEFSLSPFQRNVSFVR